jgi:hypothetical protein
VVQTGHLINVNLEAHFIAVHIGLLILRLVLFDSQQECVFVISPLCPYPVIQFVLVALSPSGKLTGE